VVTSVVESAAGLWPTAQLAAATGSRIPHGLATADWLAADLGGAPRPIGGRLWLPARPGSGFKPHPA
jgi:L-alanine-DL-glutamate epimerase-like enolase superfamily enzyme